MKKIMILFLAILIFSSCAAEKNESESGAIGTDDSAVSREESAFDTENTEKSEESSMNTEEEIGVNLLSDPNFEDGFVLLATDGKVAERIKFGSENPAWKIGQWWSKYSLENGKKNDEDGKWTMADEHKSVEVNREKGSVTLSLDATHDFEKSTGIAPSAWPHLLIEQEINPENASLADAESLTARLSFTVDRCKDMRTSDKGLHAQLAWFIYIVDKNPESEGYGNFLWFGLNLFTPPHKTASAYAAQDNAGGAGNFIYSLSSSRLFSGSVKEGKTVVVETDILPYIEKALNVAHSKGFMLGTEVEDCSVTGMNIGYEIFDRWDISVTFDDMGIWKK